MWGGSPWWKVKVHLTRNNITAAEFLRAITTALEQGRGKDQIILMVGPANSGITFILKLLCRIFQAISNPSINNFVWDGEKESDYVLNDFRWSEKLIWLQYLLDGDAIYKAPPKSYFSDLIMNKGTLVFAIPISHKKRWTSFMKWWSYVWKLLVFTTKSSNSK